MCEFECVGTQREAGWKRPVPTHVLMAAARWGPRSVPDTAHMMTRPGMRNMGPP